MRTFYIICTVFVSEDKVKSVLFFNQMENTHIKISGVYQFCKWLLVLSKERSYRPSQLFLRWQRWSWQGHNKKCMFCYAISEKNFILAYPTKKLDCLALNHFCWTTQRHRHSYNKNGQQVYFSIILIFRLYF